MTAPVDQAVEAAAKLIYETWKNIPEYRLWQNGGNSLKQDEARRIARQFIELASQQEVAAPVGPLSDVDFDELWLLFSRYEAQFNKSDSDEALAAKRANIDNWLAKLAAARVPVASPAPVEVVRAEPVTGIFHARSNPPEEDWIEWPDGFEPVDGMKLYTAPPSTAPAQPKDPTPMPSTQMLAAGAFYPQVTGYAAPAPKGDAKDAVFIHWTSDAGYLELWLSKHDEMGHVYPLAGPLRCPPEFAAILASKGTST